MKTVTLPGTTISVGARLTPTKTGTKCQTAALVSPIALVAFGGGDWASSISTSKKIIPLALQWADGVTTKSAGAVAWEFSDPDEIDCTLREAPSSTSASLYINSYYLGTITVTATVDGIPLTATISTIGE